MKSLPHVSFRPLPARRRLLILLLAIATAITIALLLLYPPGGVKRTRPVPQPCGPGQQSGCVGGKVDLILEPTRNQAGEQASASR